MTTGYTAALATLVAWTISTFVLAKLSRLVSAYTLNKAALFFSIFLLGILVCVIDGLMPWELFTVPSSSNWLWLGISGILGKSLGDYFGFYSLRILGARRRSMITTLGPGFTWLFGLVILSETMNWLGIGAMFITVIFLLLLINNSAEKDEVGKENFGLPVPGLLFGIAAAALTGLAFILSKKTMNETGNTISAFHGTWIRIITAFLALMIFDIIRNKHTPFIKPFLADKQKAWLMFNGILFGAVLGLSFALIAITRMNAAAAYTIFSLLPVSVILVSVIIYKKKISPLSWLYSLLAIAGVIILVWRDELTRYF
ncbi:MAG TPA: DMT family transporter [Ferruginibacter sp.]|nr:DMT family transporter [Ferruginibacter sp.]